MSIEYICSEVARILRKYKETDPFPVAISCGIFRRAGINIGFQMGSFQLKKAFATATHAIAFQDIVNGGLGAGHPRIAQ